MGQKKTLLIGLLIIFVVILIFAALSFFIKPKNEKAQNTETRTPNIETNLSSLELNKVVSFLDFCLNATPAQMEELRNLSTEEINLQGYHYEDVSICRDAMPSSQKVEQLKKMQNIWGQKVFSASNMMYSDSISKHINTSCVQLWEINYRTMGVRPNANSLAIHQCNENYYLSKQTIMNGVTAKTDCLIYKIANSNVSIILNAIK